MKTKELSCEEFQRLLPQLVSSEDDPSLHPHAKKCELCRALLRDLELIQEEAERLFGMKDKVQYAAEGGPESCGRANEVLRLLY